LSLSHFCDSIRGCLQFYNRREPAGNREYTAKTAVVLTYKPSATFRKTTAAFRGKIFLE